MNINQTKRFEKHPTMNKNFDETEINVEICNHCGHSVSFGSGRFVNRIPDLNDILTRLDNNLKFPLGDFVCNECDNKITDDF